jgi:hypothetical protein
MEPRHFAQTRNAVTQTERQTRRWTKCPRVPLNPLPVVFNDIPAPDDNRFRSPRAQGKGKRGVTRRVPTTPILLCPRNAV